MVNEQKDYVEKVRRDYVPHERTKLDKLKALDKRAHMSAISIAWILGTVGALVLGVGMCLALGAIGNSLSHRMALGVVIGCVGIAIFIADYFIYKAALKAGKRKYGEQIIALSNEILGN